MDDEVTLLAFFLGLGVALITYVAKDLVGYLIEGHRLRRRVVSYVMEVVDRHAQDLTALDDLIEKVHHDRENKAEFVRWAFQWDAPPTGASVLVQDTNHLVPVVQRKTAALYDAMLRADRIREMYNSNVVTALSNEVARDGARKLAATALADLRWEYSEIIEQGCRLLLALNRSYPLLSLNRREYKTRLEEYAKRGMLHTRNGVSG